MKNRIKLLILLMVTGMIITSCEEEKSYPEVPNINYQTFRLFLSTDALGNDIFIGQLEFEFTDGDGNIGMNQPDTLSSTDSLNYNLFLSLYDYQENTFKKIEDLSSLNFRIPYIESQGEGLKGTITVDLEYKTIEYDTIFYTFYIQDRDFNRSNTDTSDVVILSYPEKTEE